MGFRATDPQRSLLESEFLLPAKKRRLLEKSWATPFREEVLPLIDEELFRDAFKEGGRPNVPIRMLVGLHLLKEWNDLTDEQVIENLQFNLQWHAALGLTAETADACQKTLHNFRKRMLDLGLGRQVFETVTAGLAKKTGVSLAVQRLDSTHVVSNIAKLTRLGLLTETVTHFLRGLRRDHEALLTAVPQALVERYLDREGYFADAKRDEVPRRLDQVARDMLWLVERFGKVEVLRDYESFSVLQRVFGEQCDVLLSAPDSRQGQDAVRPREPSEVGADSVQSPHDPDATYGHKGKGYEVQIAETCGEDEALRLVTHVSVNGAHESDIRATVPVIEALDEAGMKPEVIIADTNYGGGENIVQAAEHGVELVAPVQDPAKNEARGDDARCDGDAQAPRPAGLAGWKFSSDFHKVLACTAGHAPLTAGRDGKFVLAVFSAEHCANCPYAAGCPASKLSSGERRLHKKPAAIATEVRQHQQRQSAFKTRYKIRSGIESTNRELKQRHGFAKPRVRGRARLDLAVHLKVLALNAKRACGYYLRLVEDLLIEPQIAVAA
jgi:hypothetical protein